MYEANYPEILKICFIINGQFARDILSQFIKKKKNSSMYVRNNVVVAAPRVFAFAFAIAKKCLNEYTLSKIQIYKNDPAKWKKAIFQTIPRNQLPVHFGGTLCDPDGNPRYTSKVVYFLQSSVSFSYVFPIAIKIVLFNKIQILHVSSEKYYRKEIGSVKNL